MIKKFLTVWLLITGMTSSAEDINLPMNTHLEEFFTRFRSAAQDNNATLIRELSHRKSRMCVNANNTEYYDKIIEGMIRVFGHHQEIEKVSYKPTDAEKLEREGIRMSKRGISWPVNPAGKIIINYKKPNGTRVANLHVAQDQDHWRWIHVCKISP